MRSLITVGVSDTPTGRAALRWALGHAARNDATVLLLHVVPVDAGPSAIVAAGQLLTRAVDEASTIAPVVPVSFLVLRGGVAEELISATAAAGMLVVGGRRGSEGEPGGSPISWAIAAGAACPVVVVPDSDRLFAHGVVLGLDDSASGRAAAAFAGSQAASSRQRLTLVRAWESDGLPQDESREAAAREGAARRAADELLSAMRDHLGRQHPEVAIDVRSIRGPAADVLGESSAHALLLVLGTALGVTSGEAVVGAAGTAALRRMRAPIAFVHTAHVPALTEDRGWEDAVSEGWSDSLAGARRSPVLTPSRSRASAAARASLRRGRAAAS
ncbi:universal stress protein [Amnibacterium sp.]|uniref:universal stress protein n=1 Tax=Amnibacterium sp. TaxID=1872496 RepID=UPI0026304692|nr:universal stress protein [Amnibacterium sp.]MCU1472420.1 universal stress protein [Amnibacterium sp.]